MTECRANGASPKVQNLNGKILSIYQTAKEQKKKKTWKRRNDVIIALILLPIRCVEIEWWWIALWDHIRRYPLIPHKLSPSNLIKFTLESSTFCTGSSVGANGISFRGSSLDRVSFLKVSVVLRSAPEVAWRASKRFLWKNSSFGEFQVILDDSSGDLDSVFSDSIWRFDNDELELLMSCSSKTL